MTERVITYEAALLATYAGFNSRPQCDCERRLDYFGVKSDPDTVLYRCGACQTIQEFRMVKH